MYCIVVTKPLVIGTPGTPGSSGLLDKGDKWAEVQESIISMAFATKAKAERWAYRQGGIEEHDAAMVARGQWAEFDFFQRHGKFQLCETSQYPAKTHLSLLDLGARELPPEPAPKKSGENGWGWGWADLAREQQAVAAQAEIARQHALEREREREREQAATGDYPTPF